MGFLRHQSTNGLCGMHRTKTKETKKKEKEKLITCKNICYWAELQPY